MPAAYVPDDAVLPVLLLLSTLLVLSARAMGSVLLLAPGLVSRGRPGSALPLLPLLSLELLLEPEVAAKDPGASSLLLAGGTADLYIQ